MFKWKALCLCFLVSVAWPTLHQRVLFEKPRTIVFRYPSSQTRPRSLLVWVRQHHSPRFRSAPGKGEFCPALVASVAGWFVRCGAPIRRCTNVGMATWMAHLSPYLWISSSEQMKKYASQCITISYTWTFFRGVLSGGTLVVGWGGTSQVTP